MRPNLQPYLRPYVPAGLDPAPEWGMGLADALAVEVLAGRPDNPELLELHLLDQGWGRLPEFADLHDLLVVGYVSSPVPLDPHEVVARIYLRSYVEGLRRLASIDHYGRVDQLVSIALVEVILAPDRALDDEP